MTDSMEPRNILLMIRIGRSSQGTVTVNLSVQLLPALHVGRAGISVFPKEHQNLITEAYYILIIISLNFKAWITKF
jgi:hypothetical protein